MKIWNSNGNEEGIIDVEYNYNFDSEVYYINDGIYILISGKPGIFLYDWNKKTYERWIWI